jgi:putative transposase
MRRLTTLLPSQFLGVVERDRDLQIPVLVWALVFGFAAGESRTLAGFRRSYNSTADETISPGGFYQRLTPTLAACLRDLVKRGLDEVAVPDTVDADIDRFRDVMIADGTESVRTSVRRLFNVQRYDVVQLSIETVGRPASIVST